jgi:hypothetical protein
MRRGGRLDVDLLLKRRAESGSQDFMPRFLCKMEEARQSHRESTSRVQER